MAWRLKMLQRAAERPRSVAQTCRHFGLSRRVVYKWKKRFEAQGAAGLCDRPKTPHRSPRATKAEVVSKILYLREHYHFYLKRFHHVTIARVTHALLSRA